MSTPAYPGSSLAKYNTLSIVAIVGAFVVPLIGAVLGFIALRQIKVSNERGRNLAIAAIAVGIVITVVYVIVAISSALLAASMSGY
ncbi:DUF4190 domain-containing protein [Herbiconiux sp. YIM B11900]|uniref:DUF4190 domain-containing protein n=1 Tax=Herbiconiux sp. YIM B11900 TaxID=3404131 RepID=UPI003F8476A7